MKQGTLKHGHRLRIGRFSEENRIYAVTTCTYRRTPLFADFFAGREVVKTLRSNQDTTKTLCFTVMPDHLHWLFQLNEGAELANVMKAIKSISSRRIRSLLHSQGPVWQTGYFDRAIRSENDILPIARYIVANPVRAGIVQSVREYPLWDAVWIES